MMRALRTGLFIGMVIGLSACAAAGSVDGREPRSGAYGSVDVGT